MLSRSQDFESRSLLRDRDIRTGLGFHEGNPLHFQATGLDRRGIGPVSLRDSARILHDFARIEQAVRPEVKANDAGWEQWLEMLVKQLPGSEAVQETFLS